MPKFIEKAYCDDVFYDWRYQFKCIPDENGDTFDWDEMYNWCLINLGPTIDWHVRDWGVIMHKPEDALLFKLTWF